jgi:hypothetical protein
MASHRPAARILGTTSVALALSWAAAASAQTPEAVAAADAAFKEASRLRAAGNDVAACPKFAESKALAPAVGVSLYLADCYAKTGRSASAWREFRDAEKMARERGDKRADLAAQRAASLAPNLNRLTVEVPADAAKSGEQIQLDGAPLPPDSWNVATPVDPGDHIVVVTAPGQPARTLDVHVEAGGTSTTLPTALASAAPPTGPAIASVPPSAPAPVPEPSAPATSAPHGALSPTPEPAAGHDGSSARWISGGLMLAGAVGVGLGTWLVTYKTQDMVDGQLCDPHLQAHAIPEAAVAFSVGGAALLSGAVLFYLNRPGRNEVSLAPSLVPGEGGGAVLHGRF